MFIDSLKIIRGTDDKVLRHIQFHMGTNIVTDDQNGQTHNGAGKTTALRLLDVVLGSKDKKHLYTDDETGNANDDLKQFIEESRIKISCTLSDILPATDKAEKHTLTVGLFDNGTRSIDGTRYGLQQYLMKLNDFIFNNAENKPTFRQLISPFLRISMKGDDDAFLHCLGSYGKNIEYRNLYDYLFGIPHHEINDQLKKANDEFKAVNNARKKYKSISGLSNQDIEKQRQLLVAAQDEASALSARLNDIIKPEDFKKNRDRITAVRDAYEKTNKDLSEVQFQIRLNKESLEHAAQERYDAPDRALMERFYNEIRELQPSIRKTFDDLVAFNTRLGENEIHYFTDIGEQLKNKEKEVLDRRADIEKNNTRFLALLNKSDVSEYEDLQNQYSAAQERVGEQEEILETLIKFDKEYIKAKKTKDDLQAKLTKDSRTPEGIIRYFTNSYFKPLTEEINGEKPILTYDSDAGAFPLSVSALSKGISTGKRKSLIIAYDFAYQKYAADKHKSVPQFVVHDVLENIEEHALKAAVRIANKSNFQYITAMLHSKLESAEFSELQLNDMVVLTLSEDDRLFKDNQTPNNAALFPEQS